MIRVTARGTLAALVLLSLVACSGAPAQRDARPVAAPVAGQPVAGDAQRLVALQGARNVRSLAGIKRNGRSGPESSFLRAADLNHLTPADHDALTSRGVKLVLDLRTAEESAGAPDPLATDPRFRYERISLLGSETLDLAHLPDSLGTLYVQSLAANGPQYRAVFELIARQKDGAVLFHCTAGKDRTGMIAALLQSLAGVPRRQIIHDYSLSAHYLGDALKGPQMEQMLRLNPRIAALMGSPPEAMEAYLNALERQHGGAQAYLRSIGVSDMDVQQLRARLRATN